MTNPQSKLGGNQLPERDDKMGRRPEEAPGRAAAVPEKRVHVPARRRNFTEVEIERGLVAMALNSGNSRRARAALKAQGLEISHQTLHKWTTSRADHYERVRREVLPRIKDAAQEMHMDLAARAASIEQQFLDRIENELPEIPARDLPGGLRNVSTTSGIHTDKARDLRGDPTSVIEHRSFEQLVAAMRAKGITVDFDLEGEAEEIGAIAPADEP